MTLYKQYFDYQRQYEQKYGELTIVLMQVGKFYEAYAYDNVGKVTAMCEICDIQETRMNKKIPGPTMNNPLMCGIPLQSISEYTEKLVAAQYTIVIVEQTLTNAKVITRDVTNIISPGASLDSPSSCIACVYRTSIISVCILDILTGESRCIVGGSESDLEKTLYTWHPNEIIYINGVNNGATIANNNTKGCTVIHQYNLVPELTKIAYQNAFLSKIFQTPPLLTPIEYLGLERYPSTTVAYIILVQFVYDHSVSICSKIRLPYIEDIDENLKLSANTIEQLNLIGGNKSLFDIINHTKTALGSRALRQRLLNPISNKQQLCERYNEIQSFIDNDLWKYTTSVLTGIKDIQRYHRRIYCARLHPREFILLHESYEKINILLLSQPLSQLSSRHSLPLTLSPDIIIKYQEYTAYYLRMLNLSNLSQCTLDDICENIFNTGVNDEIDTLVQKQSTIMAELIQIKDKIGDSIGNCDLIKLEHSSKLGYYVAVSKTRAANIKKTAIFKEMSLKYTEMTGNTKITCAAISELSEKITIVKQKIVTKCKQLYLDFLLTITNTYNECLCAVEDYIAKIDVCSSCASTAIMYNYCKPTIDDNCSGHHMVSLRHPIVERILTVSEYIANDIDSAGTGLILTGLNASGKSTLLRAVGLAIIMAQSGFYVPATNMTFCPYKSFITKIATHDNLYNNESTFTIEMHAMKSMLRADANTLILADELCNGSEYYSSLALVASAIVMLANAHVNFIFTTHLHELMTLPEVIAAPGILFKHMLVEIVNDKLIFHRKLTEGSGPDTYGLEIAEHLHVGNSEFIKRALDIRRKLKGEISINNIKKSRYNANLYIYECTKCGATENLHTHHIREQHTADKNGNIILPSGQVISKNMTANLQVLCMRCHRAEHS